MFKDILISGCYIALISTPIGQQAYVVKAYVW